MADEAASLAGRIEQEFARSREKLEQLRREKVEEHQDRQERLALFERACDSLKEVWGPRLDALMRRFGKTVMVTPRAVVGRRQATFDFASNLARISLTFTAATDIDVRRLVLDYGLEITPMLMSFPGRDRLEQDLEGIDTVAIGAWMDDRIMDFVRTYLSLQENEYYLKPHMVEDPVAHVRFPKFAAASMLERGGKTLYFIAQETREEFEANEAAQRKGA